MCSVLKISLPNRLLRQVQIKMYLPESPFFKTSLARASRQILMSVPDIRIGETTWQIYEVGKVEVEVQRDMDCEGMKDIRNNMLTRFREK